MAKFRPGYWIATDETIHEYRNNRGNRTKYKEFATYRELKRNLKQALKDSLDDYIHVSRSRRGEWGEYFEDWRLINDKPTIIKEGWM